MHATLPSITPCRHRTARDLQPGDGLDAIDESTWRVTDQHTRFSTDAELQPAWYEIRVHLQSTDNFTVRKRLELAFESDTDTALVARETFTWNRSLNESFVFRLPQSASRVRLDLWDAQGTVTLTNFELRRVSGAGVVARAVREKVRLTRAYRCFGPALVRGGALLLRGSFRTFGRKLVRGLTDARVMHFGGHREAEAAWWRRHMISVAEAEEVQQAVEAMTDPTPVAVVLAIDPERLDQAHVSVASVRCQLYPHWTLYLVAAGPSGLTPHLKSLTGTDRRCKILRVSTQTGLPAALDKALGHAGGKPTVVLPSGVELTEHALYHLVRQSRECNHEEAVAGLVGDSNGSDPQTHLWLVPANRLRDAVPTHLTVGQLSTWIESAVADAPCRNVEKTLAFPANDRRLAASPAQRCAGRPVVLSGDLHGLSGYDHLVFALLKGLPSAGVDLRLNPSAFVRPELLPPGMLPPLGKYVPGEPQIVVSLPRSNSRYPMDANSALITMWETDHIPDEWVQRLNRAGVVIVPSRWGAECFRRCGVTVPIEVAPLGFDPLVYHPVPDPTLDAICTFGTAGALADGGIRKNAQRVIDVFRRAFPDERDVKLRVKITPNSPALETHDDRRVEVIRAILPTSELADWYRSLTAYVNASAGEGFGLHLIEAMACGRPLISADYSGLTEFFDREIGYPVDYRLVPVSNEVYGGHWADIDDDSMIQQMRRVYADREEAERLGALAAARAKRFTWKASGRAYLAALRKHGILGE